MRLGDMPAMRSALLFLAASALCYCQTPADRTIAAPAFAVATFKPSKGDRPPILRPMKDGYRGSNLTLHMLIANAYENPRVEGEPAWANLDSYDFEARLDSPETTANSSAVANVDVHILNLALQELLKERCGLWLHTRKAIVPAYDLIIASGGVRLKPDKPNDPDLPNGSLRLLRGEIVGQGVPIARLAELLSAQLDRPVLDRTQLTGRYDFTLQWQIDDNALDNTSFGGAPVPPSADDPRAGIPAALEKQLGLKLTPAKTTVDVLVVDHLARPSAN